MFILGIESWTFYKYGLTLPAKKSDFPENASGKSSTGLF
jgi:hypothetical protein